jgi:hypothetical protein
MKISFSNKTLPIFILLMLLTQPVLAGEKKLDGASWVAQVDIVFAPRKSSMYVQDGKLVERARDGDRYVSYCEIVTKKKHDNLLTIKKGATFKISKTTYQTIAQDVVTSTFKTNMKVESADYPLVRSIDCSVWDDSAGSYLSVEQMQDTMKGVFILN